MVTNTGLIVLLSGDGLENKNRTPSMDTPGGSKEYKQLGFNVMKMFRIVITDLFHFISFQTISQLYLARMS